MASFKVGAGLDSSVSTEMNTLDDDVSAIIGEYSIPNMCDITSESLLTKSQYAKVIFHDLLPCYPTDADIWCRYSLTDGITSQHGDRVALFRVGWSSVHEHVQFEVAPITDNVNDKEFQVLFKAEALPKDTSEFYQLCYVNVEDSVCGASVPFQFRHPVEEELCEVEEQGGLMVVRSRTAINGEKLRDAAKMIDELESEKLVHEEKIHALESTKDSLSIKLEELSSIRIREAKLREDMQVVENDKFRSISLLHKADKRIEQMSETMESLSKENIVLTETIESLSKDNIALTELLKSESQKTIVSNDVSHYKLQIDNMQQMLDALAQSKEMASQALRCEQSKVMTLNIEHDKYKFRAQHLEEENRGLQLELHKSKTEVETLQQLAERTDGLLHIKIEEYNTATSKLQPLIKRIGQVQFEVTEWKDRCESLQLVIRQRDNQILMLDMELKDLRAKGECFDQLNEEYANLKRQLQDRDVVRATVENLTLDNTLLRNQTQKLQEEVSQLLKCRVEKETLSSELHLLSVNHEALQNELYNSTMNNGNVQELQEQNASLHTIIQQLNTKQTEVSQTATSIEGLKYQLSVAEASNSSLMQELKKIRELQPHWEVDHPKSGLVQASTVTEALAEDARNTTTSNAPSSEALLKQMHQTLLEDKAKLNKELEDVVFQENAFKSRTETLGRRLLGIEEELAVTMTELDTLIPKNQRDKDDLLHINSRMASVQQQLLLDDQKEGRDFHDSTDQNRLERMSKRCYDLQCSFTESTSRIHDLQQNVQVLNQERESIDEELNAKPWDEKRMAEEKCKILEKLVNLDQELITVREDLFKKSETESMKRSCFDFPKDNPLMEKSHSYELRSSDLESCIGIFLEDAIIPEERKIRVVFHPDCRAEDLVEAFPTGAKDSSGGDGTVGLSEPIERAVETGVLEGLLHGINTLKQEAAANLNPDSINSSTESLANVEQKCVLAEQACQEQERVLEEKLAVVLTGSVRKELLEGMLGMEASTSVTVGTSDVESDLRLRLELAAKEYRKIYTQKLKLEKQLAKVQQKQATLAAQTPSLQSFNGENSGYVCPICGVTFSSTQSDTFTRHFEDHLS